MINLSAAGISETEAKCYEALLDKESWKPAELAEYVGESRTNCYKILDNLVDKKLARRFDNDKKLHYQALNPSRLLYLAREERRKRESSEKSLEIASQQLLQKFYNNNEQAGIQFFQGKDEIKKVFQAVARSSEEIVSINSVAGTDFYGLDTMHDLRSLIISAGVSHRCLTPDNSMAQSDNKDKDPLVLLKRTWLKSTDYTAPVEWIAFEDKLYIIYYGSEAMAILIESRQISEAFKQIAYLVERGQKLLPDYKKLPEFANPKPE